MTTQPEALRLLIEDLELNHEYCPTEVIWKAAAELRRLHTELQQWKSVFGHLGTADECGNEWIKVMEQRDEMLKALRWIADRCPAQLADHSLHGIHREIAHDAGACARAAIAKAEGQT